jgi:hypothetical protein
MFRIALLAIILAFLPSYGVASESNIINKEVRDAIYALQNQFNKGDAPYIRFLSSYSLPENKREAAALTTSFLLHSLVGVSHDPNAVAGGYYPLAKMVDDPNGRKFVPLRLVNGSKTLWWIDLREFNFTEEAWEKVSVLDPYFTQPLIQEAESGLLRIIAGNAVVSMPWFIFHASDSNHEINAGRNTKIYNTLLYANAKEPKTIDEFRKLWGLPDIDKSRQLGNEFSTLVTKSKNVALHNRLLFGYITELGWYYQSYDVLTEEGNRDYVESIPEFKGKPPAKGNFDAGEAFASNQVKMQIYALYDQNENIVDFADARAVRHLNDVLGNSVVRTPHSCFDCHSNGPLVSENTLKEFVQSRMSLYTIDKADSLRIERSMLSDKFEENIEDHQNAFTRALKKINGLSPDENAKNYLDVVSTYDNPLTLEDVARECGVTQEVVKKAAERGLQDFNNRVPGRLDLLLKTGEGIPRNIFDSPGKDGKPGLFQQIMVMIYGLTIDETKVTTQKVVDKVLYIVDRDCDIMSGSRVLGRMRAGTEVTITKESIGTNGKKWVFIEQGVAPGWIMAENVILK